MCNQYHLVGGEVVLQTKAFKDMSEINYDQTKTCQVSPQIHLHFTCRICIPVLYLTILFCMLLIVDNRGIILSFMILLSVLIVVGLSVCQGVFPFIFLVP